MKILFTILVTIILFFSILSISKAAGFNNLVSFSRIKDLYTIWFFQINANTHISLVSENGYNLDSKACTGKNFKISYGGSTGEWYSMGGYSDTPPIVYVDDLDSIINKILELNPNAEKAVFPPEEIIKDFGNPDVYIDPDLKIPVYFNYQCNWGGPVEPVCAMTIYSSLICQPTPKTVNTQGATSLGKNLFQVTANDYLTIDVTSDLNCVFYWYGNLNKDANVLYIYRWLNKPTNQGCAYCPSTAPTKDLSIGTFQLKQTFQVVDNVPPSLSVASQITNYELSPQSSTYARIVLTNEGDPISDPINLQAISMNTNSQVISCTSSKITSDSPSECIVSLSPSETTDVQATLTYQYNQCGERQSTTQTVDLGTVQVSQPECEKDSDCGNNNICCESVCHNANEGVCVDVRGTGVPQWIPSS